MTSTSIILNPDLFGTVGKYLVLILPIALPIIIIYAVWIVRFRWLTMKFVEAQPNCLLEIRLPKEITKSPAAMEIFFSHLNQSGAGNLGEAFLDGKTRPWFSCEIISINGYVRFFVWCSQAKYRNIVEAQLYAQYPNVEIFEAEDYTKDFYYDPDKYIMYGLQYALTQSDPFPIKTYIDYGLEKDQKEEYKIDPITSVIEFLGSMKKGENAWIQILIQKHEQETFEHGILKSKIDPKKANFIEKILIFIFGSSRKLKDEVDAEIKKIKQSTLPEAKEGDEKILKFPNPSKGQQEVIAALERSATKTPFDCMIRSIYIPEKDVFTAVNISGMIGSLKQFGSLNLNGFKPGTLTDISDLRKDWSRIIPFMKGANERKIEKLKKDILHAYKLRSFFQWPYKHYGGKPPFVLTTEELATIFHFPSGMVSQTPTLQRVGSKKSEAPSNLPI